jgi:hypothetical protein
MVLSCGNAVRRGDRSAHESPRTCARLSRKTSAIRLVILFVISEVDQASCDALTVTFRALWRQIFSDKWRTASRSSGDAVPAVRSGLPDAPLQDCQDEVGIVGTESGLDLAA